MNAQTLHEATLIIDGLNASHFLNGVVLERLHTGGVTAVNATIAAWHTPEETMTLIGDCLHLFDAHSDLIMPIKTVADIHAAKKSSRVGLILGFQDTAPIGEHLQLLSVYHQLGVRVIQLTYNFENRVGFGCQAPADEGLTVFGKEVVAEMNRLGIVIDLSHCGEQTTLDAIALSRKPVAITHANAASQFPHPRNKSDAVLEACAQKGGVIGALSFPAMLTQTLPATIEDYVDAIDFLVQMVGVDHVALGPDFMEEMLPETMAAVLEGLPPEVVHLLTTMPPVQDFASVAELPNVTVVLQKRGYAEAEIKQIMGENWVRLFTAVWHP